MLLGFTLFHTRNKNPVFKHLDMFLVVSNNAQYNVKAAYCTKPRDMCIAEKKMNKIIIFSKPGNIV